MSLLLQVNMDFHHALFWLNIRLFIAFLEKIGHAVRMILLDLPDKRSMVAVRLVETAAHPAPAYPRCSGLGQ